MNSTIRVLAKALDELLRADAVFCFSNRFWSVQGYCVPQFHPARPAAGTRPAVFFWWCAQQG
jgi:hypothetical protein